MKESLQNIRDIILKPSAVFTRLKFEPKWLLALTLCCIGFVAVESATRPFEEHILSHTAAQEGDDANKAQTSDAIIGIVIRLYNRHRCGMRCPTISIRCIKHIPPGTGTPFQDKQDCRQV